MFIPVICAPQDIRGITLEQLSQEIECICGKQVPVLDTMGVYVLKEGNKEPCWLPACNVS
jgi:hypothetical protein